MMLSSHRVLGYLYRPGIAALRLSIDIETIARFTSNMRAPHSLLTLLLLIGTARYTECFVAHHQPVPRMAATTSYLFRNPNRYEKLGKIQRLKQLVPRKLKEARSTLSVLLFAFALFRAPIVAQAAKAPSPTTTRVESMKVKAESTLGAVKENKRGVAVSVGAGTSLLFVSKATKKKSSKDDNIEVESPMEDDVAEMVEALKEVPPSLPDLGSVMLDEVEKLDSTMEVEENGTKPKSSSETNKAILELLNTVGANPDVVYSFLGSSLAFVASENLLVSGIAFAWIFDLFQEPTYTDDNSSKEVLPIEQNTNDTNKVETKEPRVLLDSSPEMMIPEAQEVQVDEISIEEDIQVATTELASKETLLNDITAELESYPPIPEEIETFSLETRGDDILEKLEKEIVAVDLPTDVEEVVEAPVLPVMEPSTEATKLVVDEADVETPTGMQVKDDSIALDSMEEAVHDIVVDTVDEVAKKEDLQTETATEEVVVLDKSSITPDITMPEEKPLSLEEKAYKVVMDLGLLDKDLKKT